MQDSSYLSVDALRSSLGDLGIATLDLQELAQAEPIKKTREMVSPWLWVFSVVGFGMAVLNTRRINAMWQRHKNRMWKGLKKP